MAIITLPDALHIGDGCSWGQQTFDLSSRSDATGAEQVRAYGPAKWTISLRSTQAQRLVSAGVWDAVMVGLRGGSNLLHAYHPARVAPAGTLRGALTLSASAAAGAASVQITGGAGQAGRTLLPGDMLQIGSGLGTSQLVMCASLVPLTADSAGTLSVPVEPPLRAAYASATAVTWDRPRAYFRRRSAGAVAWSYAPGGMGGPVASGYAWDGIETWTA